MKLHHQGDVFEITQFRGASREADLHSAALDAGEGAGAVCISSLLQDPLLCRHPYADGQIHRDAIGSGVSVKVGTAILNESHQPYIEGHATCLINPVTRLRVRYASPQLYSMSHPPSPTGMRDFTMNALFYDPIEQTVLDFVGGVADLQRRELRMCMDPAKRLADDPLRALRAVRFAVSLRLRFPAETREAIQHMAHLCCSEKGEMPG